MEAEARFFMFWIKEREGHQRERGKMKRKLKGKRRTRRNMEGKDKK